MYAKRDQKCASAPVNLKHSYALLSKLQNTKAFSHKHYRAPLLTLTFFLPVGVSSSNSSTTSLSLGLVTNSN